MEQRQDPASRQYTVGIRGESLETAASSRQPQAAVADSCQWAKLGCAQTTFSLRPAIRLVDLATAKDGAGAFRLKAIVW